MKRRKAEAEAERSGEKQWGRWLVRVVGFRACFTVELKGVVAGLDMECEIKVAPRSLA